jgi:hypothetical protein
VPTSPVFKGHVTGDERPILKPAEGIIVGANTGSDDMQSMVPLHVARSARLEVTRAISVLTDLDWLGRPMDSPAGRQDLRRFSVVLELPILDGSAPTPIRKSALVDIGIPAALGGAVVVEVGWQSDSLSSLFPVFAGQLRITSTMVVLDGLYSPPFGRLGVLIDQHLLHFVARRTAQAFLGRLATQIER